MTPLAQAIVRAEPALKVAQPPQASPRPAPQPPAKVVPPPPVPGEKTEAQRALRPQAEQLLLQLQARYPVAFAKGWPKPLAIGIHQQILVDLGCDPKVQGLALRIWCSSAAYLANTVDMDARHSLDGMPVAELTVEERARAATRLDAAQAAFKQLAKQRREAPSR